MLGELIGSFRAEKNLTLEQVGEAFGVSKQAVSQWEQGETIPALETVIRPLASAAASGTNGWAQDLAIVILNVHPYFYMLNNSTKNES